MNNNNLNDISQDTRFDAEPWNQEVNSQTLFINIQRIIASLVIMSEQDQAAITLWIFHTFFIKSANSTQLFECSPILNITSPVRACGKSTLREILEKLCPKPISMANGTTATIFRIIEKKLPTLFIDEADTFIENRLELIGIMNEGYKKSGKVFRQGGKQFEDTQEFSTWSAKCIVGIGNLPDTLQSRCIQIKLRRKMVSEKIMKINEMLEEYPNTFSDLKSQLIRFAIDNEEAIKLVKVELNAKLDDRTQDNWLPLLKIAKYIDGTIYKEAVNASEILSDTGKVEDGYEVELLKDMRKIFIDKNLSQIKTMLFLNYLKSNPELPWHSYPRGGLTAYHISAMLKPFGIYPSQYKEGKETVRGYSRVDFEDTFNRYLS